MKYTKETHLNLLKYKKQLETEGKQLSEMSREDRYRLYACSAHMIARLYWENRHEYFELLKQLLNGTGEFSQLPERYRSIQNAGKYLEDNLILLDSNEECENFSDLIDDIILLFNLYCPDSSYEKFEVNSEQFNKYLQEIFIEMRDYYL